VLQVLHRTNTCLYARRHFRRPSGWSATVSLRKSDRFCFLLCCDGKVFAYSGIFASVFLGDTRTSENGVEVVIKSRSSRSRTRARDSSYPRAYVHGLPVEYRSFLSGEYQARRVRACVRARARARERVNERCSITDFRCFA